MHEDYNSVANVRRPHGEDRPEKRDYWLPLDVLATVANQC